jgi:transcriptional regulator with XRE-family HTH domain
MALVDAGYSGSPVSVMNDIGGMSARRGPDIRLEVQPNDFAYFGSGGTWSSFLEQPYGTYVLFVKDSIKPVRGEIPLAIVEDEIRRAFGLTVTELAEVCHTSRKTIYNWREGTAPRSQALTRLFELNRVAKNWLSAGPSLRKEYLRIPLVEGRSLYELLNDDIIDHDAIAFAQSRVMFLFAERTSLQDPFG